MTVSDELQKAQLALNGLATLSGLPQSPYFQALAEVFANLDLLMAGNWVQILSAQSTKVGTPASLVQTDLASYTLPGGTVDTDGNTIRLTAHGVWAAGTDERRIEVLFGGVSVFAVTTRHDLASSWRMVLTIIRDGATSQMIHGTLFVGYAPPVDYHLGRYMSDVAGARDWANDQILKITGQNVGASVANTLICNGFIVELLR